MPTAPRIEPENRYEQEMLDVLLIHPWRVTRRELNGRRLKTKQRTLASWVDAGLVTLQGSDDWGIYELIAAARHDDQAIDAFAREATGTLRAVRRAMDDIAAQHDAERAAAADMIRTIRSPGGAAAAQADIIAIQDGLDFHRAIGTVADGTTTLSWLRVRVEEKGLAWSDVVARAEEFIADEDARSAAEEAAAQALIDPEADPLGADS